MVIGPREIASWHLVAAQEARAAGDKERANARLNDAMYWSPKDPRLLLQRAAWNLEDGRNSEALDGANKAVELSGDHYAALMVRAQIYQRLGQHAEAIEDWKVINRLSQTRGTPPRDQALNGLAYARAVGKLDLKEASQNVAEALELRPSEPAILDTRGYLLHLQGLHEGALVDMNRAVEGMEEQFAQQPKDLPAPSGGVLSADIDLSGLHSAEESVAVVRYHRALVLKALGREDEAKKDLDRARELIGREPDDKLF
jgi:tetratricopeptide (TPR) repeat protein